MKVLHWSVAAVMWFAVGCGSVAEEAPPVESLATQESGLRACTSSLDCVSGCTCTSNQCVSAFGPPPPAGYCDTAPVRACTTGADCLSGCNCVGNVCVDNGFSPPKNCLLAPPDAYENDNAHTSASSYPGSPQLNHSFHVQNDVDWVLVATPVNQVMTVETYNLRNGPTMRVDIYAYTYATRTLGQLLASTQTTVCSQITPSCQMYRTTANVVAGGVYAVKVTDLRGVPAGSDWRPTAMYDLKMY
ncbi:MULTISPECIES: hypothetical protein [Corallococcus]|uniref:hypothetical protein n=1 Tax=Corallococcus TaxID=83461 RepID=UPI0011811852|nr:MULTISPECIES: hypothetical protein [Corallococcus]NBD12199.1 hypothetical protein [Corallococcus silvisoli]TSC25153.1 hypothetical protein FOF48_24785 [Corallococcus sp. Z5C101001]